MMPREIGLVVFDLAGTVLDFGSMAPAGAFQRAFAERGVDATMREVRAPMGLHKKDHMREMLRQAPLAAKWKAATGHDWTEADIDALYARVTPMQVAAAAEHSQLVPHALECLVELRDMGLRIAVSTGYFHEAAAVAYAALERQGFHTDFRICADDVRAGRPKPWMIFRAMEALDVYPPSRVMKVGDTVIDIQDGHNAGVWSVGVVESSSEMGREPGAITDADRQRVRAVFEEAGADHIIGTLAELPGYIQNLNRRLTDSL